MGDKVNVKLQNFVLLFALIFYHILDPTPKKKIKKNHIVSLPMFQVVQVIVLGAKNQSSCLNFTFMTSYTEHFRVLETPLLESQVRIMKKSQSCWMHSKKRKRGISSILHFFSLPEAKIETRTIF